MSNIKTQEDDKYPIIEWLWGSYSDDLLQSLEEQNPRPHVQYHNDKYLNGYDKETTIIWPGFNGKSSLKLVKTIMEKYRPARVEVRGSSVEVVATKIIIISEKPPETYYDGMLVSLLERSGAIIKKI